jgi:RNA polymerase sigma factor (sigma-70 family)
MQQLGRPARERSVTSTVTSREEARRVADFAADEGPRLVRFAFLLTGSPDDAQDLTQSVMYRLAKRGIGDLDDPVSYVRRCLVNEHRSQLRRLKVGVAAVARDRRTELWEADPGDAVAAREATLAALAALSSRQRAAVVLRYYGDLPDDQIAATLSRAPGTVRSLLSRAMPFLREHLTDETESRHDHG